MTHRADVARGRDVVARWCDLAERRLEYLTELFETGRWRRYHSERAFLENIQEAKTAVETWRNLLTREASRDNSAVDMSWLGHTQAALPRNAFRGQLRRFQPQPAQVPAAPLPSDVSIVAQTDRVALHQAPSAPATDHASGLMRDIAALAERYPLLRNVM
jgi:uncharacterized repeat protein (TIGR03809 family)